jgi:hypothetical protein
LAGLTHDRLLRNSGQNAFSSVHSPFVPNDAVE